VIFAIRCGVGSPGWRLLLLVPNSGFSLPLYRELAFVVF
jgi:hypothetical protein